jgi:nitrite reductase/ring-hydroxylating ferredoxin subunit
LAETGEFVAVVAVDDLRPGFLSTHVVEGRDFVIATTDEGVAVFDGYCSHAEFKLGDSRMRRGCEIECPMHGARFRAGDGSVLKGPATEPLEQLESRIEDGTVMVLVDWLL